VLRRSKRFTWNKAVRPVVFTWNTRHSALGETAGRARGLRRI